VYEAGWREARQPPPGSKTFRTSSVFRAMASWSKILNDKKYIFNTVNSGHTLFSGQAQTCLKILDGKKYIQYSENFQDKLCSSRHAQVAQKSWTMKKFSIVHSVYIQLGVTPYSLWGWSSLYIHLGVFGLVSCVIWTKVVTGYNDFDLDHALIFCKNRTIGCRWVNNFI